MRQRPSVWQRLLAIGGGLETENPYAGATAPLGLPSRLLVALAIGLAATALSHYRLTEWGHGAADFRWPLLGAQLLRDGHNPYAAGHPYPYGTLYYPLPALLIVLPFTFLPTQELAGACFFGVSSALLAVGLTRRGWSPLLTFGSASYFMAASLAQWSPLIMAAVVTPRLYWMLIAKPSGGFAVAAAFPSVRGILVALLIIAATTAVFPWWVGSWLAAVATGGFGHVPPALALLPLSAFLLMGIMYYRLPTGRLLFLLSLTPQLMAFYDQLLLWLIPRSGGQFVVLTAASWVGFLGWNYLPGRLSLPGPVHWSSFWILLFVFGPALALVAGQHHGWLAGSARTRTARGLDPGRATASS